MMSPNKRLILALTLSSALVSCVSSDRKTEAKSDKKSSPAAPAPRAVSPAGSADSQLAVGQKFFQTKEYQKAFDYFNSAANKFSGNKTKELESQFWALRAANKLSKTKEELSLSQTLLLAHGWTTAQLSEIYGFRIKAHETSGDGLAAISDLLAIQNDPALSKQATFSRARILELVQSRLNKEELERVATQDEFQAIRAAALFRLGEIAVDERDLDRARSYFGKVLSQNPNSEEALRSQDLLRQLDSVRKVEPKTIGLVLPMTGKYANISQKTLRAVQMGLGLYGNNISSFRLATVDSEGNPDNARRGVEKLIKEDNVIAIIGSVLSKTAPAVASKASELGVPSIALSQKSGITELGSSVFRNSLTSEMQVRHLVKTSFEELGLRKFAVLYPNDQYGVEFANIFWDEVLARGGSITSAQAYSPKETDFKDIIQRLVGTYYIEARADEYKIKLKDWSEAQTKRSARNLPPEDLLPPIVDFDAIFIPDSAKALGQISAMLAYNGVKDVRLLGTNLWNVPGLAKRAGNSAQNIVLVDGFVTTDPNYVNSYFVKEYQQQFNEDPGVFELQAYDSALLLRQLISQGANNRESLGRAIDQIKNFPGSLGPLNISIDREIQRPLLSLTLENGNIVPLVKASAH